MNHLALLSVIYVMCCGIGAYAKTPENDGFKRNEEYNRPLMFDQIDHGLILPPLELEYDLSKADQLFLGNTFINSQNFFLALSPLGKTNPHIRKVISKSEAEKVVFLGVWPRVFFSAGNIEMISRKGDVLWSQAISEQDISDWSKQLDSWKAKLVKEGVKESQLESGIFRTRWSMMQLDNIPLVNQRELFRFCLSQTDGKNSSKLCSPYYGMQAGKQLVMSRTRLDAKAARVLVSGQEAPLKNTIPVATDSPISFFAELKTGQSYEFVTVPQPLRLVDISEKENPNILEVVGHDTRPVGTSTVLNPDEYGVITRLLGFQPTIGDDRKFWTTSIDREKGRLFLPGKVGGVFRQRFDLKAIPSIKARVYLHEDSPLGTYTDGSKFFGQKNPETKIETSENSLLLNEEDPNLFTWHIKATERGKLNRSYLDVKQGANSYRAYYEVYKGYPREISGRFTGVNASGENLILGEIAYNQWFETLLGWNNYWLGRQRWGVSAKHFVSLNDLKVSSDGRTAPLSVTTVDLKYRLSPGLWGRDETLGLISSYQSVNFDNLKVGMLGVGGFWARSMPSSLNKAFNLLPFMRYPKWVDVEFIYYVSSMDANVELDESMALNFHGKVLWTDWLFGEAGFGVKRYGFSDKTLSQKAELNTFYGTVGLGINF